MALTFRVVDEPDPNFESLERIQYAKLNKAHILRQAILLANQSVRSIQTELLKPLRFLQSMILIARKELSVQLPAVHNGNQRLVVLRVLRIPPAAANVKLLKFELDQLIGVGDYVERTDFGLVLVRVERVDAVFGPHEDAVHRLGDTQTVRIVYFECEVFGMMRFLAIVLAAHERVVQFLLIAFKRGVLIGNFEFVEQLFVQDRVCGRLLAQAGQADFVLKFVLILDYRILFHQILNQLSVVLNKTAAVELAVAQTHRIGLVDA